MKALLVSIVSALGALVAASAASGCVAIWIDEPEMPTSMLEI